MSTLTNSTSGCCDGNEIIGAKPANVKWNVVRGDTASIVVQFLEKDEVTYYDTSDWTYSSYAYDAKTNSQYELSVELIEEGVKITATPELTASWGTGRSDTVAELTFDLQVTIDNDTVWTPIIGTIGVIGDVTGVLS